MRRLILSVFFAATALAACPLSAAEKSIMIVIIGDGLRDGPHIDALLSELLWKERTSAEPDNLFARLRRVKPPNPNDHAP